MNEEPTGTDILDGVETFIRRFVALPSDAASVAVTLWAAHAHAIDHFQSTPRLAATSAEYGSGKTRLLEVLETLVPHPMHAVNATPAALFRSVSGEQRPTILFDEIDTIFGPKAKENEELRGLLNAGHRRSGVAYRCVGEGTKQTVVEFPAYCAVALAGIGDLPDTIASRSVFIRMRRRAPHEVVEAYRERLNAPEGHRLRGDLAAWLSQHEQVLSDAWPEMPAGVTDRPADVWEPLLAVADLAGGDWPKRARTACLELTAATGSSEPSIGVRLLGDCRHIFDQERADKLTTVGLVNALCEQDEAPWGDLRGKSLDARGLARRLRPYGVVPKKIRDGDDSLRGYTREDFYDAWLRYLPPAATSEQAEQVEPCRSTPLPDVPDVEPVPEHVTEAEQPTGALTSAVPAVPDVPISSAGVCAACGFPCEFTYGGHPLHPSCRRSA